MKKQETFTDIEYSFRKKKTKREEFLEIMAIERKQQEAVKPRLKVDETKAAFTLQEAAVLLDLTYNEVRRLIQTGEIEAKKYGLRYLIPRDDIKWFLFQQKLEREN